MGNTFLKPQKDFICEICFERVPSKKKFNNGGHCMHPFCDDCIASFIKVKIEESAGNVGAATIHCPGLNCKRSLQPLSCRPIISTALFNTWCDRLCHSWVLDRNRCYCPYSDCSALVLNECGKKVKKTRCPSCKREFCFECKCVWHEGFGCYERKEPSRDTIDPLVLQVVEENKWTRCPRCGHAIELVEGCMAVKCICGFSLCHSCGRRLHWEPCNATSEPVWTCLTSLLLHL